MEKMPVPFISCPLCFVQATNRAAPTGFSADILDGAGKPCNQCYPAVDKDGATVGEPFTLKTLDPSDKTQQYHFYEKAPNRDPLPFVVVDNMMNDEIPKFGYKLLVLSVCNGVRDYGDVFSHGCLVSTVNFTDFTAEEPKVLVKALLAGGGANEFLADLQKTKISGELLDYAQKTY